MPSYTCIVRYILHQYITFSAKILSKFVSCECEPLNFALLLATADISRQVGCTKERRWWDKGRRSLLTSLENLPLSAIISYYSHQKKKRDEKCAMW